MPMLTFLVPAWRHDDGRCPVHVVGSVVAPMDVERATGRPLLDDLDAAVGWRPRLGHRAHARPMSPIEDPRVPPPCFSAGGQSLDPPLAEIYLHAHADSFRASLTRRLFAEMCHFHR